MRTKKCAACQEILPGSAFSPHKAQKDGLYAYCRLCARNKQRKAPPPVADLPGEEWRPVSGWGEYYHVSNLGRVKRLPRSTPCRNRWGDTAQARPALILKATPTQCYGHLTVGLVVKGRKTKRVLVHRLVCEAFHGPCPPDKQHCAHGDGDPANNKSDNLRWATAQENSEDTRRHGKLRQGEDSNLSCLSEDDVRMIRARSAAGETGYRIAKDIGLTATGVYKIIHRKNWKHI